LKGYSTWILGGREGRKGHSIDGKCSLLVAQTCVCVFRLLRRDNSELTKEKQRFDRTAEYVCQRVLKIIGAARREGNFNSQLVGELKRWNEKLEVGLSPIAVFTVPSGLMLI